jgi:antirestriction protein ArdC
MTKKAKFDVTEKVKQALLEGLQKEGLQWFKPWKSGDNAPINHFSGRAYQGFNQFFLNAVMKSRGYESNEWATLNSIVKSGFRVKSDEMTKYSEVYNWKISYCVFKPKGSGKWYSKLEECIKKEKCEAKDVYHSFSLFYFRVYNISQIEGDIKPRRVPTEEVEVTPIESAEKVIRDYENANTDLIIKEVEQDRAYYSPSEDKIVMPLKKQFKNVDNYYKTLFHEMIHSTGHESRLKREGIVDFTYFGADTYAFEELIAESGAMMLSGLSGICTDCGDDETNSQAYINGWVKRVKMEDSKAIVSALTKSAKAVDYVLEG